MNPNALPQGVSIVPFRNGLFAVSQRLKVEKWPGLWQFPGGHVEPLEDPLRAAWREFGEETGLWLPAVRFIFLGVARGLIGYKGERYDGHRYGIVLDEREEPKHSEPDKHTPWHWVNAQAMMRLPMLQGIQEYAAQMGVRCGMDSKLFRL